jgi:hypothetical protein
MVTYDQWSYVTISLRQCTLACQSLSQKYSIKFQYVKFIRSEMPCSGMKCELVIKNGFILDSRSGGEIPNNPRVKILLWGKKDSYDHLMIS